MKVYVLDMVGYDVRGGMAQVFASLERAKAECGHEITWLETQDSDGNREWAEDVGKSLRDIWVITEQEIRP